MDDVVVDSDVIVCWVGNNGGGGGGWDFDVVSGATNATNGGGGGEDERDDDSIDYEYNLLISVYLSYICPCIILVRVYENKG